MTIVKNPIDFKVIFAVKNSNPNGDPDNNGEPREYGELGKVASVCLKRKVKNYVEIVNKNPGFELYYKKDVILDEVTEEALSAQDIDCSKIFDKRKKLTDYGRKVLTSRFFDIRTTGALVTYKGSNGIRGPVQLTIAESVDHIDTIHMAITRCCSAKFSEKKGKEDKETGKFGGLDIVPFAYYTFSGYICPVAAKNTGMTEADVELFLEAIENMWEYDASSTRGEIYPKALVTFTHEGELRNAKRHELLRHVQVVKKTGVEVPMSDADYKIEIQDPKRNGIKMHVRYLDE